MAAVGCAGPATLPLPALGAVAVWVATVAGWPWWRWLRTWAPPQPLEPDPDPDPDPDDALTMWWRDRWQQMVLAENVLTGSTITAASRPRPWVVEIALRLPPTTKISDAVRKGDDIDSCLDLMEGSTGFVRTGRARDLRVSIVERSYIASTVPYRGPTWRDGKITAMVYADGTPGSWIARRPKFGTPNGLVVGSTGSGKSRALGVLIDSYLHAGVPVVIGDAQEGQSLPAWRHAASEFHTGMAEVSALLYRFEAEVMRRSKLLGVAGVEAFDPDDARVVALGITHMVVIIDECQLALDRSTRPGTLLTKAATNSAATCRKTGCSLILATQLPQMESLGGSVRLRDALIAGNAMILRLGNKGGKSTILPDDFPGDPFSIPEEDADGNTTAGTGYLRSGGRMGMRARVPMLDEAAAAAAAPRVPAAWLVDPVDVDDDGVCITPGSTTRRDADTTAAPDVARLATAFGVAPPARPETRTSTQDWVLACLATGPQSAGALLGRPDCPVSQPQLYAVLADLSRTGKVLRPEQRGDAYRIHP
jgi:hypothetical protein